MKNSIVALLLIVGATAHGQSQDLLEPIPYVPEALGPYEWNVTTVSPRAQRYFNQGMQLRYGFSMPEAARSMAMARRIDPNCAMCFWGEAFALGSFLNGGMSKEQAALAREAILEAEKLIPQVGAVEADLIKAALLRYPDDYEPTARRSVDQAFADAMAKVHDSYPQHSEVSVIYATALFLLERRRGYRDLNDPKLLRIHELLTAVLEKDPAHPGACHLYIHATESTAQPELGLPCAEQLGDAVPGASHVQHMPSHSWNEVGLWSRSVEANLKAKNADRAALRNAGFSYGESHNLHMLVFASSYDGQGTVALDASDQHAEVTGDEIYPYLSRVRFQKFDEILQRGTRPESALQAAVYDFAVGYAQLRAGQPQAAKETLAKLSEYATTTTDRLRFHDAGQITGILASLLEGEIALTQGDHEAAISLFRHAVAAEDQLDYDEPEPLPFAARHWLGSALIEANQPLDAELVYRAELDDHPHNGWSLFGLLQALQAQGKTDGAAERDFAASWARADLDLESSRP